MPPTNYIRGCWGLNIQHLQHPANMEPWGHGWLLRLTTQPLQHPTHVDPGASGKFNRSTTEIWIHNRLNILLTWASEHIESLIATTTSLPPNGLLRFDTRHLDKPMEPHLGLVRRILNPTWDSNSIRWTSLRVRLHQTKFTLSHSFKWTYLSFENIKITGPSHGVQQTKND